MLLSVIHRNHPGMHRVIDKMHVRHFCCSIFVAACWTTCIKMLIYYWRLVLLHLSIERKACHLCYAFYLQFLCFSIFWIFNSVLPSLQISCVMCENVRCGVCAKWIRAYGLGLGLRDIFLTSHHSIVTVSSRSWDSGISVSASYVSISSPGVNSQVMCSQWNL